MKIELTEQEIKDIVIENIMLRMKVEDLEEQLEIYKKEYRMPLAEERGYWGIYG